jgi:hypothetical protein
VHDGIQSQQPVVLQSVAKSLDIPRDSDLADVSAGLVCESASSAPVVALAEEDARSSGADDVALG